MSTKTMTATIDKEFQGWFSYTSSSYDKNNKISLSFSAPSGVDVNNITISSAKLYITCSSSGKAAKKDFKITYNGKNETTIKSNGTAYGRETSITLTNSHVLSWLKGGTLTLTSADPSYKTSRSSNSGGWYSENYVKINKAYIVLEYSVNAASISTYSKTMNFNSKYNIGWSSTNTSYLYSLTLTSGSYTQKIITQKNYTTASPQIEIIPNAETFSTLLTNNPSKTSFSATLKLETFDSSKTSLGTKSVSVTLNTTSSVFKPTVSITITPSKTYESKNLANHTTFKFKADASATHGKTANLKYLWTFPDGTTSTKSEVSSKIFSSAYTAKAVKLTVTDERNYSTEASQNITVVAYSKPQITKFVPYRTKSLSSTTNIDTGEYVYVGSKARGATYTSKVGGDTANNSINWTFTLDGKSADVNSSNIISNLTVSVDTTASIKATITDTVGNTDTETVTLPSANYLLHFLKNTNAVGIGCAAVGPTSEQKGKITLGWPTKFNDKAIFSSSSGALSLSEGGTEATSRSGAWENIVKEGGTITGALTVTGDITTNYLTFKNNPTISSSKIWNVLRFKPTVHTSTDPLGQLCYQSGSKNDTTYTKSRFVFRQHSYDSSSTPSKDNYEDYYLPNTDGNLSGPDHYDILTTKNHYYSHTVDGKKHVFEFGTLLIQTGEVDFGEVSAATEDVVVTFKQAFATTPVIVIGFNWGSDDAGAGRWTISARAESATGFTARVNNGENGTRSPDGYWIAIGKRA